VGEGRWVDENKILDSYSSGGCVVIVAVCRGCRHGSLLPVRGTCQVRLLGPAATSCLLRSIGGLAGLVFGVAVMLTFFALPPGPGGCGENLFCAELHSPKAYGIIGTIYLVGGGLALLAVKLEDWARDRELLVE